MQGRILLAMVMVKMIMMMIVVVATVMKMIMRILVVMVMVKMKVTVMKIHSFTHLVLGACRLPVADIFQTRKRREVEKEQSIA